MSQSNVITYHANLQPALLAASYGFKVFPVRSKEETLKNGKVRGPKSPKITGWQDKATVKESQIRRWSHQFPDCLFAMLTGPEAGFSVTDLDRHGEKDGFKAVADMGVTVSSPITARTAGGGEHFFFAASDVPTTAGVIAPGVDTKGEGGYILIPGTVLPDGRTYAFTKGDWEELADFRDLTGFPPMPEALRDALRPRRAANEAVQVAEDQSGIPAALDHARAMLDVAKGRVADAKDGHRTRTLYDAALWAGGFVACSTLTEEDATAALMESAADGGMTADYDPDDLLRQIANGIRTGAKFPILWIDPASDFDLVADDDGLDDDERAMIGLRHSALAPADDLGTPMMQGDKLIPNQHNTILLLGRNVDSILPDLAHNDMTHRDEWRGGEVTDAVIVSTRAHLERLGLKTIGKELVADAVSAVARYRHFHPVRNMLNRLAHDGSPRLDSWLVRLVGAKDTPYTRAVGRLFLIQMVARVMQPGCKADHTLVLIGPQGAGKSALCRLLAGAAYFSDTLPPISGHKDTMEHLLGVWVVELAELAPSRKSEAEDQKAFLTATVDRFRPSYAKRTESFPRQNVFIGTTNDEEFLRDPTGGRRFWPVHVGKIDLAGLAAERDQLLAEAVAAYRAGEDWWMDRAFEEAHARPVQDAARVRDSWADPVAAWLDKPASDFDGPGEVRAEVTIAEVLEDGLGLPMGQHTRPNQDRVAAIMRGLGWTKEHTKRGKVWRRPKA